MPSIKNLMNLRLDEYFYEQLLSRKVHLSYFQTQNGGYTESWNPNNE